MLIGNLEKLDAIVEAMLRAARVPGAALAVVAGDDIIFAKGYGYRDLDTKRPMTPTTPYPLASTSKAFNATLLGMLVDEGRLGWDVPVRTYLPTFRLIDPLISAQVTVRDLVTMRTGLPRHDWLWIDNAGSRADLIERLQYLELSSGFRERFQYNNLTVTAAGYIAERVTGRSWEELVQERILAPLGMQDSTCVRPPAETVTQAYHENSRRELVLTRPLPAETTAPSGGALYSTVADMARWVAFNLRGGQVQGRQLIQHRTLSEIHSPQIVIGDDSSAPTPGATYAMGWFVDTYNGCARISHGGNLHDVSSEVALFPKYNLGLISFSNLSAPSLARLLNQQTFDLLRDVPTRETLQERLELYEKRIEETRRRGLAVPRVHNTSPSHSLDGYAGIYAHPGYGEIEVQRQDQELIMQRNSMVLPLQHWHFDAWVAQDHEMFPIHTPHAFDRASRLLFEMNADGEIAALSLNLESAVALIRFERRDSSSSSDSESRGGEYHRPK